MSSAFDSALFFIESSLRELVFLRKDVNQCKCRNYTPLATQNISKTLEKSEIRSGLLMIPSNTKH